MNERRTQMYVYRGTLPLWLILAIVAPLGLLFLTSLLLALAIAGAGAALATLLLPRLWKRGPIQTRSPDTRNTIELDPSQYHRLESGPRADDDR
jgi:hypothetical protein